jgi:hypothetical protein
VERKTDRQTGDLISLFSFLKNMFKNKLCAIAMGQSPHGKAESRSASQEIS